MRTVLYIHGAFSSGLSFQRIQEKLPKHDIIVAEYSVDQPLDEVIAFTKDLIADETQNIDIIAHSLGGIIAAAASIDNPRVNSILTLSSPFGGSRIADVMKWFSGHELFRSLNGHNAILAQIQRTPPKCKHRAVVTCVGNNPMMFEPNDGVVSLKSQMALPHAEQIKVDLNHFEVLLSDTTVKLIKEFTFK